MVTPLMARGRFDWEYYSAFERILSMSWPSYVFIAVLQLKIIWKIWVYRDLTAGDTASYFLLSYQWFDHLGVNFVWSPLYTAFYGSVYWLTQDVYAASMLHRVFIVMAAALGVLALMRMLLPPALALLIAAWWAVVPTNFNTGIEVHLFGVLPVLAAWLVASKDTPLARGMTLAIFVASGVLVRNELLPGAALFGLICLVREISARRKGRTERVGFWRARLAGYGIPLLAAAILCTFFYWRTEVNLAEEARVKHTLNMCQVYAYGYAQREPTWTASPWEACAPLMEKTFGQPYPSLASMIWSNPRATLSHFLWNLSLVPNGMQLALFGSISGTVTPEYFQMPQSSLALILSIACLLVLGAGTIVGIQERKYWWPNWLRDRSPVWLAMLPLLVVAIPVVLTQRPRPAYFYADTVILMAMVGAAVQILTDRWRRSINPIAVAIGAAVLVLIPSFADQKSGFDLPSGRPVLTLLRRLQSFEPIIADPKNKILLGDNSFEMKGYLRVGWNPPRIFDPEILASRRPDESYDQFFASRGINVLYLVPGLSAQIKADPLGQQFLSQYDAAGWRRLGGKLDEWELLYRD